MDSFFFPRSVNSAIAGLKKERPLPGEAPSTRFRSEFSRVLEKSRELGKTKSKIFTANYLSNDQL
jgi:hypothetical protein